MPSFFDTGKMWEKPPPLLTFGATCVSPPLSADTLPGKLEMLVLEIAGLGDLPAPNDIPVYTILSIQGLEARAFQSSRC